MAGTTYDPILDVRELRRFTRISPPRLATALLLQSNKGLPLLVKAGDPVPSPLWGKYRYAFLIDVGDHQLRFEEQVPSKTPSLTFQCVVTFICRVADPEIVVARNIHDVAAVVRPRLFESIRAITIQFDMSELNEAEQTIGQLLRSNSFDDEAIHLEKHLAELTVNHGDSQSSLSRRNSIWPSAETIPPEGIEIGWPVYIYLSEGSKEVGSRIRALLQVIWQDLGFDLVIEAEPVLGSFFQRLRARARSPEAQKALHERLMTLERAVEVRALSVPESLANMQNAQALAAVIQALDNNTSAAISLGPLLILKTHHADGTNTIHSKMLTTAELRALERRPELLKDPETLLLLLNPSPIDEPKAIGDQPSARSNALHPGLDSVVSELLHPERLAPGSLPTVDDDQPLKPPLRPEPPEPPQPIDPDRSQR
jgi:hypothetical protein